MSAVSTTEIPFRLLQAPDAPCWFEDTRTGQSFLSVHPTRTLTIRAAGERPRRILDALSPTFESDARERIREAIKSANTDQTIGCFLDDAPDFHGHGHWAPRQTYTLLEEAIDRPAGDSVREAALAFLRRNYASFEWLAGAWGLDIYGKFETLKGRDLATAYNTESQMRRAQFTEFIAEAYFSALARALRAQAPTLLNLGVRFAEEPPFAVLRVCGQFCDVISLHASDAQDPVIARAWLVGRKPLLVITTADESDLAGIARLPMIVGIHAGSTDTSSADADTLVRAHAEAGISYPTEFSERDAITFAPGPIADRALQIDLLAEEATLPPEITLHLGASATLFPEDGTWLLEYDTGSERGFEVMFAGPTYLAHSNAPEGATDLNGYTRLLLDAEIPEGTEFKLLVHEAGVSDATDRVFDTRGGDEGQAFETNLFIAKSGRRRYTYAIAQLIPQTQPGWQHGNQHGSGNVHLQSVRGVGIAIVGNQGAGTIKLRGLKLYRG